MTEYSIRCRDEEVRKILSGAQTQLRRPVTHEHGLSAIENEVRRYAVRTIPIYADTPLARGRGIRFPLGVPGDLLWIKECFKAYSNLAAPVPEHHFEATVCYRSDRSSRVLPVHMEHWRTTYDGPQGDPWRPSNHMPRWASRLSLRVINVRVERVHDISEEDAKAAGVELPPCSYGGSDTGRLCGKNSCPRHGRLDRYARAFADLWRDTHGHKSWATNPWVWVVKFERL